MDYSLLKQAKRRSGFECRVAQLIVKQAARVAMEKEAMTAAARGAGKLIRAGGQAAEHVAGIGPRLANYAGKIPGRVSNYGGEIANAFREGRAGIPKLKPTMAAGPAPTGASAATSAAQTVGATPAANTVINPASTAAPVAQTVAAAPAAPAAGGTATSSGPIRVTPAMSTGGTNPSSFGGVGPMWDTAKAHMGQHPAIYGAAGGALGQNVYDSGVNHSRKNEMESRLANMGFGDRLGAAFNMIANPRGFAENAAEQTFQPSLFSRL